MARTGKLVSEKVINDNNTRIDRVFFPGTTKTNFSKEYDATGKLTTETTYRVDGTQTRKLYDVDNTGDWREATIDYDKNGNRILEKATNDDGSRYDLTYGSNDVPKSKTVYNPAGKITTVTTNNPDGTQTETVYDADNKQSWREATVQYGRDGNPVSEKGINDDGSKYDAIYQPGTSKLNSHVLTRVDGTQAKTFFDPDNKQPWKGATVEYRKDGSLVSEKGQNDDGTRYDLTFDKDTGEVNRRLDYDKAGQKVSDITVRTDGTQSETYYDVANSKPWREATREFGKDGKLVSEKGIIDDGSKFDQKYDPATGKMTARTDYNPAGNVTSIRSIRADGTETKTFFDPDNKQAWKEAVVEYRKDGSLISEKGLNDNGTRYDLTFDKDTGEVNRRFDYNQAGQKVSDTVFKIDGTQTRTVFDPGNKQPWREGTLEYDKNGKLVSEKGIGDDGSKYDQNYDPLTGKTTARTEYNPAGSVTSIMSVRADGTTTKTFYDPANNEAWKAAIVEYDKNGRAISEKGVVDDGSRYDVTYDPATGKTTSRTEYNPAGQVTSTTVVHPDGSQTVTIYDPDNKSSLQKAVIEYDKYGNPVSEIGTLDDGTRYESTYDYSGRVKTEKIIYPDGTASEKEYLGGSLIKYTEQDLGNRQGWAQITEKYLSNGNKSSEQRIMDNGDIYQFYFDSKTGEVTLSSWTHNGVERFGELDKKKNAIVFKTGGGSGGDGGFWSQVFDFVSSTVRPWESWSSTIGGGSPSNPTSRPPVFDITKHDCPKTWSGTLPDGSIVLSTICFHKTDPIVLDLNRNGMIDLVPLKPVNLADSSAPSFDWNSDGTADKTAWVGPDDGLLVIDLAKDGTAGPDGKIDQAREIAFSLWKTEDDITSENITDIEGLRYAFDTNHDNVFDNQDARWKEFRVWRDANQNGISDDGELMTMSEAGIKLINLLPDPEGAKQFADGSAITGTTTALMADGSTMLVGDVSLRFQPSAPPLHMA
jgi:flagellar basal body rod protein FlgC